MVFVEKHSVLHKKGRPPLFPTKMATVTPFYSFATTGMTGYNFYTTSLHHRICENQQGTFLLLHRAWTPYHLEQAKRTLKLAGVVGSLWHVWSRKM
jgi:hypothetical protein